MDNLIDYHYINMIDNLDAFLNYLSTDYECNINTNYNKFDISINALFEKDSKALEYCNSFIQNCKKDFISYSNIIKILNNTRNEENRTHKFAFSCWLYIYH